MDYGLLGIFLVIVLSALVFTARFIISTFRERQKEFFEREKQCEERITQISTRLDNYIDHDHKTLINSLDKHADAFKAQAETNRVLYEKLINNI